MSVKQPRLWRPPAGEELSGQCLRKWLETPQNQWRGWDLSGQEEHWRECRRVKWAGLQDKWDHLFPILSICHIPSVGSMQPRKQSWASILPSSTSLSGWLILLLQIFPFFMFYSSFASISKSTSCKQVWWNIVQVSLQLLQDRREEEEEVWFPLTHTSAVISGFDMIVEFWC